jgi:cytoskeletal protein RodZ
MPEREPSFAEFLSQRLKERRMTLEQLAETTGISLKHIESFVHGRFEQLPPTPYLHGYFQRIGEVLGFDAEEWWLRAKQENTIVRSGKNDTLPINRFSGARQHRSLFVFGAIILLVGMYFGVRASKILGEPTLTVTSPPADQTWRVSEGHVLVAGNMQNSDELQINGEQLPTETNGDFSKDLTLQPGLNTVTITAKKILGREKTITRQVYYDASPVNILLESPTTSSTATSSATTTP